MDKIKSVLGGHKKDDAAAHDTHASSSATGGETHPIYDQMTERKEGKHAPLGQPIYDIRTTDGQPYTALAHHQDSTGHHGKPEHVGTGGAVGHDGRTDHSATTSSHHKDQSTNQTHAKDGGNASKVPLKVQEKLPESVERAVPNAIHDTGDNSKHGHSGTSAVAAGEHRPNVKTSGTEMSTASIKSGVIGFGPGQQGHAARPTQNSFEHNLSPDHVVGGGNLGSSQGQGLHSSTGVGPTSQSSAGPAAGLGAAALGATSLGAVKEHQPYDSTARQESYTTDTNRSFPLAGGVTSEPNTTHAASSTHPHGNTSSPVSAAGQTSSGQYSAEPTSTLHQDSVAARDPSLQQQNMGADHNHGREGLAGAAAAAAAVGATQRSDTSNRRDHGAQDPSSTTAAPVSGHNQPHEEQGLLAKAKNLVGLGTTKEHDTVNHEAVGSTTSRSTQDHHNPEALAGSTTSPSTHDSHPGALAAATAAASGAAARSSQPSSSTQNQVISNQQGHVPGTSSSVTGSATDGRPQASRLESQPRHIPGAFVNTPGDHSNTFLDYTTVIQPTSTSTAPALGVEPTPLSTATATHQEPTSALGSSAGTHSGVVPPNTDQHGLRHTGSLDEPLPRSSEEHHHGRDAALAGGLGAGAAGLGAHAAHQSRATPEVDTNKPLYEDSSPYSSRVLDPRVSGVQAPLDSQRFNSQAKTGVSPHHATQSSSSAGMPAGSDSQHHLGRDASLVGGAAAGGAALHHSLQRDGTTASGSTLQENSYTSVPASHQSSGVAAPLGSSTTGTSQGLSSGGHDNFYGTAGAPAPITDRTTQHQQPSDAQSNTGRNAALGGAAAAGLVGAGAYAGSRHGETTQQLPLRQKEDLQSSAQPGSAGQSAYPAQGTTPSSYPTQGTVAPHNTHVPGSASQQPYEANRDPSDQSHDKRNAALLGAGGAAAVGGGAYALSQQDEREKARLAEREQERLKKEAHEREKEQHRLDKEQHKHDKEVHKHDKAVAAHEKEERHLHKEQEKEQKRLAKEQHEREKEAEKEKKGGLLGFLHRDKSKKERSANSPESSPRSSRDETRRASKDSPRHSKEYAAGAGALGAGAGAMAYDENHPDHPRWKGKNLLHKEPPKGHPARESLEHQSEGGFTGKREHVGVDGPIGNPNMISGDRETSKGVYGAHPISEVAHSHTVIEPHTGLPMNVGKFGSGTGGTDGNPAIHGQHEHGTAGGLGHSGAPGQTGVPGQTGATGQSGTNWEAIKKADTPY
ncbi:hypothetical protein NX059_010313 [Plenodomus lindquistii]|nr:hypothetical protein NX059_010313 [Plenodomus lindquistii]